MFSVQENNSYKAWLSLISAFLSLKKIGVLQVFDSMAKFLSGVSETISVWLAKYGIPFLRELLSVSGS